MQNCVLRTGTFEIYLSNLVRIDPQAAPTTLHCFCGGVFVVVGWCFCGGVLVRFVWWCGGVLVVVFLWWCFCGGVLVAVWWCFCGGVVVFL